MTKLKPLWIKRCYKYQENEDTSQNKHFLFIHRKKYLEIIYDKNLVPKYSHNKHPSFKMDKDLNRHVCKADIQMSKSTWKGTH